MADEERKLVIDEDWKARVQREKEEARHTAEAAPAVPASDAEAPAQPDAEEQPEAKTDTDAEGEAEPTPFLSLVQSLAAQAMFALGLIAEQGAQQVMVDLSQAKYIVDTLMMLRDKTKGNLSAAEQGQLMEAVGELQRIYLVRAQQVQEQALKQAGVNPRDLGKKQG